VKAITPKHEVAGHLLTVDQTDHRPLSDPDLGHSAPERDVTASGPKGIDHVAHQQLLRVEMMPKASQPGVVEDVPDAASAKLARLARDAPCVQPSGKLVAIEQRDRAGVDLPGPSAGARRVLRQSLEDRTLHAGPDQRIRGEQTRRTGTDDPDIDFHAITTPSRATVIPQPQVTTAPRRRIDGVRLFLEIDYCPG
jgi:hypothetical protein